MDDGVQERLSPGEWAVIAALGSVIVGAGWLVGKLIVW